MREKVKQLIEKSISQLKEQFPNCSFQSLTYDIDTPKNKSHGDFTTNVAFKLSSLTGKKPRELAILIEPFATHLIRTDSVFTHYFSKAEVAGGGYVNFYLTEASRGNVLKQICEQGKLFGHAAAGSKERVILEYVSANPTGPLTIAHGRQAVIGDALSRIMKAAGYRVHREFYLNDGGRQVDLLGQSLWIRYLELFGRGSQLHEDGYHGKYLQELAVQVRREIGDGDASLPEDKAVEKFTRLAVDRLLANIKTDLKDMRVEFDEYFHESSLYQSKSVDQILETFKKAGALYEAEGALWFRSQELGDDKDRVLKRQTGEFTYFAADIAYHESKFKRGFDRIINLWGPDHHGYINRVKAACKALGYQSEQITILVVQLITLYQNGEPVRMSKRTGEFVTLRELMTEVGVDAARFFLLMRKIESPLDFDLDLAKAQSQDNPVYYLQYAHARICGILKKAAETNADLNVDMNALSDLLTHETEISLLRKLSDFPDVISQSAEFLEPHRIIEYLKELAALFHRFYDTCRVIGDDLQVTKSRLLLTASVRTVLQNGLSLLGVSHPEHM